MHLLPQQRIHGLAVGLPWGHHSSGAQHANHLQQRCQLLGVPPQAAVVGRAVAVQPRCARRAQPLQRGVCHTCQLLLQEGRSLVHKAALQAVQVLALRDYSGHAGHAVRQRAVPC